MKAQAKRIAIGIIGGIVLLAGLAMIVLPGPAFIVIPAALAILSTEFEWADRWKTRCTSKFAQAREKHRKRKQERAAAC